MGEDRLGCQAGDANGDQTTAPRAGVPPSTMSGSLPHSVPTPFRLKTVAGGNRGERDERTPRRLHRAEPISNIPFLGPSRQPSPYRAKGLGRGYDTSEPECSLFLAPCSGRAGGRICVICGHCLLICVYLRYLRFLFWAGGGFVSSCLRGWSFSDGSWSWHDPRVASGPRCRGFSYNRPSTRARTERRPL